MRLSIYSALFGITLPFITIRKDKSILYYFDVVAPSIPSSGVVLIDNQVEIRTDPFDNPGDICSGYSYLCIVGFETSELTSGRMHLRTGPRAIYTVVSCKY